MVYFRVIPHMLLHYGSNNYLAFIYMEMILGGRRGFYNNAGYDAKISFPTKSVSVYFT